MTTMAGCTDLQDWGFGLRAVNGGAEARRVVRATSSLSSGPIFSVPYLINLDDVFAVMENLIRETMQKYLEAVTAPRPEAVAEAPKITWIHPKSALQIIRAAEASIEETCHQANELKERVQESRPHCLQRWNGHHYCAILTKALKYGNRLFCAGLFLGACVEEFAPEQGAAVPPIFSFAAVVGVTALITLQGELQAYFHQPEDKIAHLKNLVLKGEMLRLRASHYKKFLKFFKLQGEQADKLSRLALRFRTEMVGHRLEALFLRVAELLRQDRLPVDSETLSIELFPSSLPTSSLTFDVTHLGAALEVIAGAQNGLENVRDKWDTYYTRFKPSRLDAGVGALAVQRESVSGAIEIDLPPNLPSRDELASGLRQIDEVREGLHTLFEQATLLRTQIGGSGTAIAKHRKVTALVQRGVNRTIQVITGIFFVCSVLTRLNLEKLPPHLAFALLTSGFGIMLGNQVLQSVMRNKQTRLELLRHIRLQSLCLLSTAHAMTKLLKAMGSANEALATHSEAKVACQKVIKWAERASAPTIRDFYLPWTQQIYPLTPLSPTLSHEGTERRSSSGSGSSGGSPSNQAAAGIPRTESTDRIPLLDGSSSNEEYLCIDVSVRQVSFRPPWTK